MKSLLVLVLFALFCFGCGKSGSEQVSPRNTSAVKGGTPKCVTDKIALFNTSSSCHNAKVDKYIFQGKAVYLFDPGTCGADMAAEGISANCSTIGYLGGIMGNTIVNDEEFSSATFVSTIWSK